MAILTITTDDGVVVLEIKNVQDRFDPRRYLIGSYGAAGVLIDEIQQACATAADLDSADDEELQAASDVLDNLRRGG